MTYTYECKKCGEFEVVQPMRDAKWTTPCACGATAVRCIEPPSVNPDVFKEPLKLVSLLPINGRGKKDFVDSRSGLKKHLQRYNQIHGKNLVYEL